MSTEKLHFQMEMFGAADRSVNAQIEGQKVQNSSLAAVYYVAAPRIRKAEAAKQLSRVFAYIRN